MAATSHIRSLDGLRGWAASVVIFYHGLLHYDLASIDRVLYRSVFFIKGTWDFVLKALLAVLNGESAVIVFFVLSGLVLRLSLDRTEPTGIWRVAPRFVVKRVCRLFPALIVAVVGYRVLGSLCHAVGLTDFPLVPLVSVIKNSLLWEASVIGPSWSIQTEFAATFLILVAFFARETFGFVGLLVVALYATFAIDFPMLVGGLANLWPYGLAFMLGMIMAEREVIESLRRLTGPRSQIVFLIGFVLGRHIVERNGISGLIAQIVFAALLIGSLVAHDSTKLSRFLNTTPSQFLGRISYSLYLFNVLGLQLMWAMLPAPPANDQPMMILTGLVSAIGAFLFAVPISHLTYKWIERPFIKMGNSL